MTFQCKIKRRDKCVSINQPVGFDYLHLVKHPRRGKQLVFIRKFNKNVIEYKVFIKYIEFICQKYGLNTVEFIEQDGNNILENKVTVRICYEK